MALQPIAVCEISRTRVCAHAAGVGIALGLLNAHLGVDFTPRPALFLSLLAALLSVIVLHEATHAAVARLMGYRPVFGIDPPLVFVTFGEKIPRHRFIAIALAPLVALDLVFAFLYAMDVHRLYANLSFCINTLGAAGDVWIALKLLPQPRGSLVQDTRNGIAIWPPA